MNCSIPMMGPKSWAVGLFLMTSLTLAVAGSGDTVAVTPANARPVFGKLDPTELGKIKAISQGVLTAQASMQVSPQEAAMLQSLHALSATLVQQAVRTPHITLANGIGTGTGATPAQMRGQVERDNVEGKLRPHLNALAQHVQSAQSHQAQSHAAGEDQQQSRLLRLANTVGAITQDVEDALVIPDETARTHRLGELGQQLHSRTPAQWWAEQRARAIAADLTDPLPDSPTLTTRAQHLSGLDDSQHKAGM